MLSCVFKLLLACLFEFKFKLNNEIFEITLFFLSLLLLLFNPFFKLLKKVFYVVETLLCFVVYEPVLLYLLVKKLVNFFEELTF